MTIDDLLNAITEDGYGAMIVRPASLEDLEFCQNEMSEMGFPPIPKEYSNFLKKLNGFSWNGIEFFSTDMVTDPESDYMLNDLVSANEDFSGCNDAFISVKNYVYLGRSDMALYVYNTQNGLYEVLDDTGRDVMEEFKTFDDMFVGVVAPRQGFKV